MRTARGSEIVEIATCVKTRREQGGTLAVSHVASAQHHTEPRPLPMAFGDVRVTPAPPRDASAHTDSWEAIGEGTPDASARWRPFRPRRGCERPTWPAAVAQTRDALERGMREWVEVETTNNARAIYWITPKAAHTTIVHRLGRPPFRIIATSLGHDGHGDGHDFMHSKCPCTHQCVGAVKPCSGRNSTARTSSGCPRSATGRT